MSPSTDPDVENQLTAVQPGSSVSSEEGASEEGATSLERLKERSKRGPCHCVYRYLVWTFSFFGIPKAVYRSMNFLLTCAAQLVCASYAYVMWECCGMPVTKLSQNEYLLSRYTGMSGELLLTFQLLQVDKEEQLMWMELWSELDEDANDAMDINEFHEFFELSEMRGDYSNRFFGVFDKRLNGYINFNDFFTTCWTYAPFDKERCVELSFRLLSRRGSTFDPDTTCLDVADIEHYVQTRYNKDNKKSKKWVNKRAVSLYAEIDADEGGGISYKEFREFSLNENSIFLLYGFWFQSQLRKALFGEDYWRKATESRTHQFVLDKDFLHKMMQMLDWPAVWAIGMIPENSVAPSKDDRATFKFDYNEVWLKAKEKKFLSKDKNKKTEAIVSPARHATPRQITSRFFNVFCLTLPPRHSPPFHKLDRHSGCKDSFAMRCYLQQNSSGRNDHWARICEVEGRVRLRKVPGPRWRRFLSGSKHVAL